jgi:hypothetical protein
MSKEPDILRICVDTERLNQRARQGGKVPPGLYLRDIGEVREGARAYDFTNVPHPTAPGDDDQCLSLIGSERTICLKMKTKVHIASTHTQ